MNPGQDSSTDIEFPDPRTAYSDGLLAAGGNLEVPTLLKAYSMGIFPWYAEGSPILWWSPDPRMVLFPGRMKVSKSLLKTIRNRNYEALFDTAFKEVIEQCATVPRKGQSGTWITQDMIKAYNRLHQAGDAHSVEVYRDGKLAGGLYGVSLGGIFFGESMFHLVRDASKVALYHLVELLKRWNFDLIDVQQSTAHMKSMGAEEIPRKEFLRIIRGSVNRNNPWSSLRAPGMSG